MPAQPDAAGVRDPGADAGPSAQAAHGAGPGAPPDLGALAALGEPARRALYAYIAAQGRPVSRDEAAGATGMRRATAAFHLERLVEDGLLEAGFARLSGRTGPGAGRTAKLYSRAHRQIDVSLPPRRYAVAGDILASAVEEAQRRSVPIGEAVTQAAERTGRQMAAGSTGLADMLASLGYEPRDAGPGETQLANCPFHELAVRHRELVCTLNLHLLRAALAGLGAPAQARLDPAEGRCCVTITPVGPKPAATEPSSRLTAGRAHGPGITARLPARDAGSGTARERR
jgi:predicted ArsR family transcriptional regulator